MPSRSQRLYPCACQRTTSLAVACVTLLLRVPVPVALRSQPVIGVCLHAPRTLPVVPIQLWIRRFRYLPPDATHLCHLLRTFVYWFDLTVPVHRSASLPFFV